MGVLDETFGGKCFEERYVFSVPLTEPLRDLQGFLRAIARKIKGLSRHAEDLEMGEYIEDQA